MPLPPALLALIPTLSVSGASGVWGPGSSTGQWPSAWGTEAWVLPLESLLPEDSPAEPAELSLQRLAQAGMAWEEVQIQVGARSVLGCLVPDMGRARALRFGYRLDRWAVLRLVPQGVQAVYTGRNSRMPG